MTPHRPKHKTSTDKTEAHVILLLLAAVLWTWLRAGESHGAPSCSSASSSSLTQTWLNILDQPGPVKNTQIWVVFLIQHIQASCKQTPGWFKFDNISNKNLLKQQHFKVIQTKEVDQCSISVPSALALILPAVTEAELSCYSHDQTTRKTQTDHIRRTAKKELLLHKEKKKSKRRPQSRQG